MEEYLSSDRIPNLNAFNDYLLNTDLSDYILEKVPDEPYGYYIIVSRDESVPANTLKYGDPFSWYSQSIKITNVNKTTFQNLLTRMKSVIDERENREIY